jgi:glycosyltransferase involved in cell wall biosynthesis
MSAHGVSFLAVSPYVARRWSVELGFQRDIEVIPNCMIESTTDKLQCIAAPQFIEVANASRLKNVRRLLEAFSVVRRAQPEVQLALIGKGLDADGELAFWARAKDYDQNVRFLGPQSREVVAGLFYESAIHVHSSLEESFGLTIIEAMSAGLPVIAGSMSGATSWVLDEGGCGVLVDMRNVEEMSAAMLSLIRDGDRRQFLAEAGRSRFASRFRSDSVAKAHIKHYHRVLAERRALMGAEAAED